MVIPSEYEKHSGEVFNPRSAMNAIDDANNTINAFMEDMRSGRRPKVDLKRIAEATDILGLYAGYPSEAADMEGYIKSDIAISYQEIARILSPWTAEMNSLIQARLNASQPKDSFKRNDVSPEDDIPF